MSRRASALFPLGIDLGKQRIRVAALELRGESPELIGVATREIDKYTDAEIARAIQEACAELGVRERRCVIGLSEASAIIRRVSFPPMTRREREKAARFEAARFIDYPGSQAVVRVEPVPDASNDYYIGIARRAEIDRRLALIRKARLQAIAVDHDSFGYRRMVPHADAVLDIGYERSYLHLFPGDVPVTIAFPTGGMALTQAVADSLGLDAVSAERRKRTLGLAGAGDGIRDAFIDEIATALIDYRVRGGREIRSIALAGNGARLSEFETRVQAITAVETAPIEFGPVVRSELPRDVLRAASPDWTLACGLALWEHVAA